jgi:hypothetical protein
MEIQNAGGRFSLKKTDQMARIDNRCVTAGLVAKARDSEDYCLIGGDFLDESSAVC